MPQSKRQSPIQSFLKNKKDYPLLAGVLAGSYPVFFYATNNYTLVNTLGHLLYFVSFFILLPAVVIYGVYHLSKRIKNGAYTKYVIPVLGSFIFLFFMHIAVYGSLKKKISAGLFLLACMAGYFLWKHSKKLLIIQAILGVIGLVTFIPKPFQALSYNDSWQQQPDTIAEVQFTTQPNVYFIQPDGYVNFSELYKGHYKVQDSTLQHYLNGQGFATYPHFRSNYASTLTSNSATFMMKHHYYDKGLSLETYNARNIIVSENPVLNIFKNNGYKTHFLTELPYLLLNRPEMGFDYCNISYNNVAYLGTGLGKRVDIIPPLEMALTEDAQTPKFFFIEIFNPGHIHGNKSASLGVAGERQLWIESMEMANERVIQTIEAIKAQDQNALIVMMADHGGYVGMEYTGEIYTKTQERDLLYSVFSSNLAIHWPDGHKRGEAHLKSAVNLFRVLFSYLGNDDKFLEHTEENTSYLVIKKDAQQGVYQCIDNEGDIVFIKQD
jgi:hypothetical protein